MVKYTEITEDKYMELVKGLKPLESFSDPDGVLLFGYGCPAMDTIWGDDDGPICKCEMRKDNRHQLKYKYIYYAVENKCMQTHPQ